MGRRSQDAGPPVDAPAALAASPDGYVTLSGVAVAAGVGFSWGHGTLEFQDAKRKFTLQGLSVVDVGAVRISASGYVYHMLRLEDFAGNYTAFALGARVASGEGVAYLKNDKGVILQPTSTAQGLRFNAFAERDPR